MQHRDFLMDDEHILCGSITVNIDHMCLSKPIEWTLRVDHGLNYRLSNHNTPVLFHRL